MNTFHMVPQNREGEEISSRKDNEIALSKIRKLAEDKAEFQRWLRDVKPEAALMGVSQHIFKQPEEPVTRAQWGPLNNAPKDNNFKKLVSLSACLKKNSESFGVKSIRSGTVQHDNTIL